MSVQIVTYTLSAADDDGIAQSQAPAGAGNLTLNGVLVSGGVATFAHQRRILITTDADDHLVTYTVYGMRDDGATISEAVTGPNATTGYTTQDFKTVTRVAISAASAGNVKVGTNAVGSSPWQALDPYIAPFEAGFGVVVTGTISFTVQYTYDNPNSAPGSPAGIWPNQSQIPTPFDITALSAKSANTDARFANPCWGWRVLQNSGTGTVVATGWQSGTRS